MDVYVIRAVKDNVRLAHMKWKGEQIQKKELEKKPNCDLVMEWVTTAWEHVPGKLRCINFPKSV